MNNSKTRSKQNVCSLQDFHSSFKPCIERITDAHFMLTFTLSPPLCPSQRSTQPHTQAHTYTHICMQTGVTKPWRDRVRFIAHLGWFDQWQSASSKSLPQTELNKQTGSVYTGPDNPLIRITSFYSTHTHSHVRKSEYGRQCRVRIQQHRQTSVHESRKRTLLHTNITHAKYKIRTRRNYFSDFCPLSAPTSSTGHG